MHDQKYKFIPYEFPVSRDGQYFKALADNGILASRREQLGLSQQQVADKAGISLGLYQRLEYSKDNLAGCSMKVGLAVCAVLLLDPYEMIYTNVQQPDSSTLRPHEPFDPDIPIDLRESMKPKKVGRRQIRREIMTVYVNHPHLALIIPSDVLKALGKPKSIQVLTKADEKRIVIRAAAETDDSAFDVPSIIYDGHPLVFPSCNELVAGAKKVLGGDEEIYAVECFLVKDKKGNTGVLADLNTARPSNYSESLYTTPR